MDQTPHELSAGSDTEAGTATGKRRAEDITKTPERQSGVDADQAAESV